MSVHSIDHIDDEISDRAYKGYHIDNEGEVTEFYDHRDEDTAASSQATSAFYPPQVPPPPSNGYSQSAPTERTVIPVRRKPKDAGCCSFCVGILTTIGTLPIGLAIAALFCLVGTAMFIAGGWNALDETMVLFKELGPNDGNPATDKAPQCLYPGQPLSECTPRDISDLGNRFPQVVESIKYSFYGIIPFMFIFIIVLATDSQYGLKSKRSHSRNCKTSSAGLCVTASLIVCCYIVMLAWIFWLCFTTLGIYYYRITMLRCYDLNDREFSVGVQSSVCIDLVQLGVIMFQDTSDEGFGKICGRGTTPNPTYGDLVSYCERYGVVYSYMLITFSGCLLVILGMVNFIVILTSNYTALTYKLSKRYVDAASTQAHSVATRSTALPSLPPQSVPSSAYTGAPAYIRGTRDRSLPDDDYKFHRSSKDIELDYLIDGESSTAVPPRRRDLDSNVGVNYYYKDRRQY